jgi:potassium efflux system protein
VNHAVHCLTVQSFLRRSWTALTLSITFCTLLTVGFSGQYCLGQSSRDWPAVEDEGFQARSQRQVKLAANSQATQLEDNSKEKSGEAPPAEANSSRTLQQPPPVTASAETVTLESIEAELEKVNSLPESEDPVIDDVKSLYQKAKLQVAEAADYRSSLAQFQQIIETASQQMEDARQLLESTNSESQLNFGHETEVDQLPELKELESQKLAKEIEVKSILKTIDSLSPAQRQSRITEIQEQVTEATRILEEVKLQLKTPPANDNQFFARARRTQLSAENAMLQAKISALEAESDSYEATPDLPAIQLEYSQRLITRLNKEILIIDDAIHRRRQNEIDRLNSQAIATQRSVIAPLKNMAADNVALTETLRGLALKIDQLSQQLVDIEKETIQLQREQKTTESRIRVVGLSDSFGRMLQRNRNHLIDAQQMRIPINQLNRSIAESQIAMFRWQDESTLISDLEASATEIVETLENQNAFGEMVPAEREAAQSAAFSDAEKLLKRRTEILTQLKRLEDERFQELVEIKRAQKEQAAVAEVYAELIDENILWLRNAPSMGLADAQNIGKAAINLASPLHWNSVWENLQQSFSQNFPVSILIIMSSLSLFLFRHRMVAELNRTGDLASKRGCRMFGITVSAIVQTLLLTLTKLSPLFAVGWLLARNGLGSSFSTSFGWALVYAASAVFPFELLNQASRKKGLVHCHFDWSQDLRVLLKRNFGWMLPIVIPLLVVLFLLPMLGNETSDKTPSVNSSAIATLINGDPIDSGLGGSSSQRSTGVAQNNLSNSESWNRLGRLLLIVLLLIAAVFSAGVFSPHGALYTDVDNLKGKANANTKFRYLSYIVAIGIPLILAAIAMVGYYYSAIRIGESILKTIALAIVVILLYSAAMRFLLVRRRHLRYEQLVHQRTQARLAAEQKDAAMAAGAANEMIEVDLQNEPGLDITDVSRQARELTAVIFLLIAGGILLSIWQYMLPATKIMDDIAFWNVELSGRTETVTLRDIMFSSIMFILTYFGVRNMPGMLELLLLQRLPLDAGARYAVTSIFRYILLVFGGVLALGYLKIPWSNYSWLVAAISVGLGFGLQEIVANFVSGLILLLERPVRVGDVVTIDGTTGIVSRIQMRATTVTNWDNQELVVPNKDLISGKLLNWTLSSVVNRLSLKFGVAYGTDPNFVRQLVLDAILPNRSLLKEPKPMVTFEEFGDSSLNFTLRCCVSTIERRWAIVHELNVAIDNVLKENNIEIPFPQRDLHIIDGISPLEIAQKTINSEPLDTEHANPKI